MTPNRMNAHKHARLAFTRGLEMVKQMTLEGLKAVQVAALHGVTVPTARKWLGRCLAGGEAAFADASSRLIRSPRAIDAGRLAHRRAAQTPDTADAHCTQRGVSESTVSEFWRERACPG